MPGPDIAVQPITYEQALTALAALDMDGNIQMPDCALVRYPDGWRLVAKFEWMPGVRTSSYTIDPVEVIRSVDARHAR